MLWAQADPEIDHVHLLVWVFVTVGVPIITLLGAIFVIVWKTHREARDANDAVNHRHLKTDNDGNEPPKAYDAIIAIHNRIGQVAGHVENLTLEMERTKKENDKTHEFIIGRIHEIEQGIKGSDGNL